MHNEITCRVAANEGEREAAYRLVYHAYLRAGLVEPNPAGIRITPYQLLPTTQVFVALLRGEVISTVSLIGDGELGLPMETIYPAEVQALRRRGMQLGEVSALADRRRHMSRTLAVFVSLMRVMVQYARRQGLDQILAAVHPRHMRFYQRFLSFEAVGPERLYPLVCDQPAVALGLDFHRLDRNPPGNYQTFFGVPLSAESLASHGMSSAERDRWTTFVVCTR